MTDYETAVEREAMLRDAAFLPITETVAGFELRPLTWRDYLTLRLARNPLLVGLTPSPEDLAAFLWLLNPGYGPRRWLRRWAFLRCCRHVFSPPPLPLLRTLRAMRRYDVVYQQRLKAAAKVWDGIKQYVDETLMDWPAKQIQFTPDGKVMTPPRTAPYYSDAIQVTAAMARHYGWDEDKTMDMPMKRCLQYLKEIYAFEGKPLSNPSERMRSKR